MFGNPKEAASGVSRIFSLKIIRKLDAANVKGAKATLLVIAKNVLVAGVLVCDILYVLAVGHVKRAARALYKGKIVGELGYFLAVRAAYLHIKRMTSKV
ncbi:MAG: hypothetical protein ACREBU_21735 [Nitrososphaera sp.]